MPARRRQKSGSIFRRSADGRWIAQLSLGGREDRTIRRKVARTKAEAALLLAEMLDAEALPGSQTPTGEYLRSWLLTASRSVRPNTMIGYEVSVRRHLVPIIGRVPLEQLAPGHIERLVTRLTANGLSAKSVRNVLAVLSRALTVAERQGLIRRNVARLVDPPRVVTKELDALTVEDVSAIRGAIAGDRLEALYVLALATGLRQAELLGLAWEDWNRAEATLDVRYALALVDGQYVRTEPKTRKSRRTVALPAFANDALAAHRTAQLQERLAAGQETEDGLIFVTAEGRPIHRSVLGHSWAKIADAAGVDVTFHGLRHGQASLLVALGVHPRVISERLGHSTISMTMDRYAHVARDSDRAAAALLDKAVNG